MQHDDTVAELTLLEEHGTRRELHVARMRSDGKDRSWRLLGERRHGEQTGRPHEQTRNEEPGNRSTFPHSSFLVPRSNASQTNGAHPAGFVHTGTSSMPR